MGLLASGLLATIINAGIVQEGYAAPMTPDNGTEQVIPKSNQEKAVPADAVLHKGMTNEQVETAAKNAIAKNETDKTFQKVLSECATISDKDAAAQKCVNWYKTEEAKGNSAQALEILQTKLQEKSVGSEYEYLFLAILLIGTGMATRYAWKQMDRDFNRYDNPDRIPHCIDIIQYNSSEIDRNEARKKYKELTGHEYDGPEYEEK
ncbi:MAG: hypothetical protein WC878_07735 [Candidatus Paceibacterota bacterium]|jgi:hypothetical protein